MPIGEFSKLTNTAAARGELGLIIPTRLENGYRDDRPHLIDRAIQIRGLIGSGISNRITALIRPCPDKPPAASSRTTSNPNFSTSSAPNATG